MGKRGLLHYLGLRTDAYTKRGAYFNYRKYLRQGPAKPEQILIHSCILQKIIPIIVWFFVTPL